MSWRYPLSTVPMPEEDVRAVLDCLEGGWLTMGPRTEAFEAALRQELGAEHAVCVSSGTAALHLGCLAAGVGPGDEVVVPSMTFVATAAAARFCGAEPVFCDVVSEREPTLDPEHVASLLSARTRAVIAVHFCGYAAEVEALRSLCAERGVALVEDAAQAIRAEAGEDGPMAGTVGDLGCLSFFSKKQLCVGEGGAVLTGDPEMAAKVRSLRTHAMTSATWDRHRGYSQSYDVIDVGFNFRMDEPRAALGLSRLPRLAGEVDARRRVVRSYRERLEAIPGIELVWTDADVGRASHFAFPLLTADRETRNIIRDRLAADGIQTTWYPAVHEFSDYRDGAHATLPRTEAFAARHLCLPLSPTLDDGDLDAICEAVAEALPG